MTSSRRRFLACVAAALTVLTLLAGAPAAAQPALRIRVPLFAAPGNIPPAIVGSPTAVAGLTYRVYDAGGTQVRTGTVRDATVPPSPYRDAQEVWSHYGSAALNGLPAGRYRVRVGSVYSAWMTVKADGWRDVLTTLLPIYRANADGAEPATPYHEPSHLNDVASPIANGPHTGQTVDVRGGWMDAGDQLKFTVTIAYATAMLELAGRNEAALRDVLWSRAAIGVRFLLKAHPTRDVFVSQVGDLDADHNSGFRDPATDDASADPDLAHRPTSVLTDTTGGSDVAAMAAAALALAARHAAGTYRTRLVREARAWLAEAERLQGVWTNCCYQQDTWRDDMAFAHAALWRTTGQESHAATALAHLNAATSNGDDNWLIDSDGYNMNALPAAELCGVLGAPAAPAAYAAPACEIIISGGYNVAWEVANRTAFGRVSGPLWGAVRTTTSSALTALLASRKRPEFLAPMRRATGWFLGVNPWGVRMQVNGSTAGAVVTGGITGPYHWTQDIGRPLPVGAVPGGPADKATIDEQRAWCCPPVVLGPFDTPQQVYHPGDARDFVMNELSLAYNGPSLLHFALLSPG